MTLEYVIAGALLAGLGALRLVLDSAWRHVGRSGLLGYAALVGGLVLLASGFLG